MSETILGLGISRCFSAGVSSSSNDECSCLLLRRVSRCIFLMSSSCASLLASESRGSELDDGRYGVGVIFGVLHFFGLLFFFNNLVVHFGQIDVRQWQ